MSKVEFKEFASEVLEMLKSDHDNAIKNVEELIEQDASVVAIEAAKKIVIDRFARWQAVSAFSYNFQTLSHMAEKRAEGNF